MNSITKNNKKSACTHCGELCAHTGDEAENIFCCAGCETVFGILNGHNMSNYYCLNEKPGNKIEALPENKFSFLDDPRYAGDVILYQDAEKAIATLFLPQMHCSSCLWLLEHLPKLKAGIVSSRVNFLNKQLTISFSPEVISLRQIAEFLGTIGYAPHIEHAERAGQKNMQRGGMVKIGIAGFAFANIMLLSFPGYLGLRAVDDPGLSQFFSYLALGLALPVFFYCAQIFFRNAWLGLRQKQLNIDAPIALAILVTFVRSVIEVLSHTGTGYLDSMSGIVLFMLIGRYLQSEKFSAMRFSRDQKSFFPVKVSVVHNGIEIEKNVEDIVPNDILKLRNLEIVPVDCILSKGTAGVDHSFITGEADVLMPKPGDVLYAGGKVVGGSLEVIATKVFSDAHFTTLWQKDKKEISSALVANLSRYFSVVVLLIAGATFAFSIGTNPNLAWNAATSVLIVACPCTLLLASSFANGFLLTQFASAGIYLKNYSIIEKLATINKIVFDKTGTLTESLKQNVQFVNNGASEEDFTVFINMCAQSVHPLSRAITKVFDTIPHLILNFKEQPGKGMEAWHNNKHYKAGSLAFTCAQKPLENSRTTVHCTIDGLDRGFFTIENAVRPGMKALITELRDYHPDLLSGDSNDKNTEVNKLFPATAALSYGQSPEDKLTYITALQDQKKVENRKEQAAENYLQDGYKVLMVGDGLNDAAAMAKADVGISVVGDAFAFSPACDALLKADALKKLPGFLKAAKRIKTLLLFLLLYSLAYNIVGVSYAVQGKLTPLVCAILMPASSLSVMLLAWIGVLKYVFVQEEA